MKSQIVRMKTLAIAALATMSVAAVNAQTKPVKIIQGADTLITSNQTWDADTVYFMGGKIYVTNGAELTIQPGTVIIGDTTTKGTLLITRGSKIHASGTPVCPIVFTSARNPGQRNRGDWGGVILLGNAAVNTATGTANIEGIPPSSLTTYGGGLSPVNNDNSGELQYVRIEYPGVALAPNNEINGLTMGGVGSGTLIDFVQVSFSGDDSFEWFGGTVNAKHLIAFRGLDDDFDTDNGFSGKVQFGIGLRDPLVADISGSKAFESDNDAVGSTNLPQTRAVFSNITASAGGDTTANALFTAGAHIRRNSHMYLYNSIVMGYPQGLLIDGTSSNANVLADTLVQDCIIAATQSAKWAVSTTGNTSVTALLLSSSNNPGNRYFTGNAGVLLTKPYTLTAPNFKPKGGSPARTGGDFNHIGLAGDPFFTKTTFVGAIGPKAADNWATTWVSFNPANTNYKAVNATCATAKAAAAVVAAEIALEEKGTASIYPNPAKGAFKVNISGFTGNVTIKVTNMNGSVVYNKSVANAVKSSVVDVNLVSAPAGLYFVTVSNGKQTTTQKVNVIQ